MIELRTREDRKLAEVSCWQIDSGTLESVSDVSRSIDGDAAAEFRITPVAEHRLLEQRHVGSGIEHACRSSNDSLRVVANVPCKSESWSNEFLVIRN